MNKLVRSLLSKPVPSKLKENADTRILDAISNFEETSEFNATAAVFDECWGGNPNSEFEFNDIVDSFNNSLDKMLETLTVFQEAELIEKDDLDGLGVELQTPERDRTQQVWIKAFNKAVEEPERLDPVCCTLFAQSLEEILDDILDDWQITSQ